LTQIFAILTTYLGETVAWTATNALRIDLASHCLHLDLSFHKEHSPGELLERVDGDVNALSRFFSQLVIHVFGNAILLIGILVVLWLQNQLAGLSLTIFAVISLLLLLGLRSTAVIPWAEYRQISGEFYGTLGEHILGREDIRANGGVGYVMQRFHQILQRWLPIYQKARLSSTILWISSVGLFTTGNAIALAISAYLWNQQAITIGTAYLVFHYTNLLDQPIERIREEIEQFQQVEASIHRVYSLLSTRSLLKDTGTKILPLIACDITFKEVCFYYESQAQSDTTEWILNNISFTLPAGKTLGVLGRTGSGKSTLTRLLIRLYDIQSGAIYFGNQKITDLSLKSLRDRIGFVTQDVQLFQATIRDNLTFFDHSIPDALIYEIIADLGLEIWLRSQSQGLDTYLDANTLSTGQAQLLALVRVFLKNPSLVILDEASSRLDQDTEKLIAQAIHKLLASRTGIVIAHRLETLQNVDKILILDRGKIMEYGDRLSLLNQPNSHFNRLRTLTGNI
jgi:ATP-binding cassette subfamily B protein/ATP-binding cassette subfamily C protein